MAIQNVNENTDFYEGYKLAYANAYKHLDVANAVENISFGIANSHLILASEEAIKAGMLFMLDFDKDMQNTIVDFDEYFHNHKHKHQMIEAVESLGLTMEKSLEIGFNVFDGVEQGSLSMSELNKKRGEMRENMAEFLENLIDGKEILDVNENWWKQADANKNKGFYVNLKKKLGEWEGPFSITEKEYKKSKEIVTLYVSRIKTMEERYKSPEYASLYAKMKKKRNKK